MTDPLLQQVAGILVFFALWERPLTQSEIERFLPEKLSQEFLKSNFFSVQNEGQDYFSTDSQISNWLKKRRDMKQESQRLESRAAEFLPFLRHLPFVRGAAVTNTVAMNVANTESDLDFLLIVQPGRIWTARFWSTVIIMLRGLRAEPGKTRERLCFSFYADENFTDFAPLKHSPDIYLAFWSLTLQPLFGIAYFRKFFQDNAVWIQKETGGIFPSVGETEEKQSALQRFWEFLLPEFLEGIFRKILLWKARKFHDPAGAEYDPEMIFTDSVQKLHHPDLRADFQKRWEENMKEFFGKSNYER